MFYHLGRLSSSNHHQVYEKIRAKFGVLQQEEIEEITRKALDYGVPDKKKTSTGNGSKESFWVQQCLDQ